MPRRAGSLGWLRRLAAAAALGGALGSAGAAQEREGEGRQVRLLVVYSGASTQAANVAIAEGLASVVAQADDPSRYETYGEHRDDQRFPGPAEDRRFLDGLVARYAGQPLDAVLALGPWAFDFALEHGAQLAPGRPILFGGVQRETAAARVTPARARGAFSRFDLAGTLELARTLQPDARRVVVFTGSAAFDRAWEQAARRTLAQTEALEVDFVSGLTLQGFREAAAALDRRTILIVLTIFEDADGRRFIPADAAAAVAEASGAPVYGVYGSYMGRGFMGGRFSTFEEVGVTLGHMAMELAEGEDGGPDVDVPVASVIDWRELRRRGLDADLRPPDSLLLNYDPSLWERFRLEILLATALFLLQAGTIAALVLANRRRRRSAAELAQRRAEVARLSRIAQLGELSGAIAHELNQPLTSILANAEAGAALLKREPADLGEIAEILHDIAQDDRRAAQVIANLRRLMTEGGGAVEQLDLNAVVRAAVGLIKSELVARGVRLELRAGRDVLPIAGNAEQLQQVLLNLVFNAADAMAEQPPETRRLTLETALRPDGRRQLTVADAGPGLPEAVRDDPFRPFVTTKVDGMGLGLSISRTIVDAHRGELRFAQAKTGARAILVLPAP